jgi:hypothetical protein
MFANGFSLFQSSSAVPSPRPPAAALRKRISKRILVLSPGFDHDNFALFFYFRLHAVH